MNTKSYLLPHYCQNIGRGMMAIGAICTLVYGFIEAEFIEASQQWAIGILFFLGWVLLCLGFMAICLSQEEEEDEYISSLRARSVFIIVVYVFIVNMMQVAFAQFFIRFCSLETNATIQSIFSFFTNVPLISFVYLAIFRGTLYIEKRKARDDRQ